MKRVLVFAVGIIAGLAAAFAGSSIVEKIGGGSAPPVDHAKDHAASAPQASGDRKPLYYRNPMGLPDVSPVPKKDSMGMDYIPVYADDTAGPANAIQVSVDKVQRAGVRTEPATKRTLLRNLRATGTVVPNERALAVVTVKFPGFIEALSVPVTGAEIRAGDPLMRIWVESPELLRKQVDLVLAMRGGAAADGARLSIDAAERNLRLFDLPQNAIDQLKKSGEPVRSLAWFAPISGTVLEKPAVVGMRFQAGDTLFRLADLSTVWVMAELAERDLGLARAGQKVVLHLRAAPGAPVEGTVDFVYPDINMATRTGKLRVELRNADRRIKLGSFVDVAIGAEASRGAVVAIPESAVIDNGARRVAFVAKGDGRFEPRDLVLGAHGDGYVEVREGVAEGESIVTRGNFLIDAESNLRAALAGFAAPAKGQQ